MIFHRIFGKYFLLASGLIFAFLIFGFIFSSFVMNAMTSRRDFPAPLFFARAIDKVNPHNKLESIKEVSSWRDEFSGPQLVLLDESGHVLYPEGWQEIPTWAEIVKPVRPYEFVYVLAENEKREAPPLFGPPRPFMPDALVKLQGTPDRYLLIRSPMIHPPFIKSGVPVPVILLGSLILSLLLGVGATMAIIYNGVKGGVKQADNVISELHKGNLKARFTIKRKDEFGKAMMRFNTMADEIEKLVLNLKSIDQMRTKLLQELAHDLRTPIASIKNLMETLIAKRQSFNIETQNEMTELALKEILYFERLVEDLLFLAQIKEPSLQAQYPLVNISDVLLETADDICFRYQHQDRPLELKKSIEAKAIGLNCDSHLLTRLFRNAIENSFSFAKSWVSISTRMDGTGRIDIIIEDDGTGFSEEALVTFGARRVTRKLDKKVNGRLSVGLGSVVMKTIVEVLGGQMRVSNRLSGNKILGARVEIQLPLTT